MTTTLSTTSQFTSKTQAIADDLRTWWTQEYNDWDAAVLGTESLPGGADLWDDMPVLDSKAAARTSPVFQRHLGIPLKVSLIRPGGYTSIDDLIADLIPKMESAAASIASRQGRIIR